MENKRQIVYVPAFNHTTGLNELLPIEGYVLTNDELSNILDKFKKIAENTMDSYTKKHIYDAINLYDKKPEIFLNKLKTN